MTLLLFGLLFLAGSINGSRDITRHAGEPYAFTIVAFPSDVVKCQLRTPNDGILEFIPEEPSPHERYELLPVGLITACSVNVSDLTAIDSGEWEVSYFSSTGTTKSELFNLAVIGDDDSSEIKWLNPIDYPTRPYQYIDISLSKIEQDEECSVIKGEEAVESNTIGVTFRDPSHFVSCRITLGPMTESLLGDWSICGRHTTNDKEVERCQLVSVHWNNKNKPNSVWGTTIEPAFNHAVNLGGTLSPAAQGTGEIINCHVVTPLGENLVIDQYSEYPYLRFVPYSNKESPVCSVAIGPFEDKLLGEWTIYGMFRSSVVGVNEVRFPFSTYLYDEDSPYNQAYNISVLEPIIRSTSIGSSVNIGVTSTGSVDSCEFITPSGQLYNLDNHEEFQGASFIDADGAVACRLNIGPFTEDLYGNWSLTGKFSNNELYTELRSVVIFVKEEPENPIDENRKVEELEEQRIVTKIGASHKLMIHSDTLITGESCHIRTPTGLEYATTEVSNIPGVTVIDEPDVECGVMIDVQSTDALGDWTLIAKATRNSEKIERRLPFTISVEELVEANPKEIEIVEGGRVTVRLSEPTAMYDTCKLKGPGITVYIIDSDNLETCSFTVLNVRASQQGPWEITYGTKITYRATIMVTVLERPVVIPAEVTDTIEVAEGSVIDEEIGSENAVYCKLTDPLGQTVFDDFGRCQLSIERVSRSRHNGIWKMFVGYPGKILLEQENLRVNVTEPEPEAEVSITVTKNRPNATITCSLPGENRVNACKFRNPQGKVLLVTGNNEERYVANGNVVRYESEIDGNTCTLNIVNPLPTDVGRWRCALQTDHEVNYGFPFVYCPWVVENFVTNDAGEEPVLHSNNQDVYVLEGEAATMSCTVNAPIRYCYFRAQNGTVFNVYPDMRSSSMEYVGLGLHAGECGIRIRDLQASDSGMWSCHAGLQDYVQEQRSSISVFVDELMQVSHHRDVDGRTVIVSGRVHHAKPLEYCRFIRFDGLGFTTDNLPPEYYATGYFWTGYCEIRIPNPTRLDLHPWTVVAKIPGEPEISRTTNTTINAFAPGYKSVNSSMLIFLYAMLGVAFVCLIVGAAPKRNRRWVGQRVSRVRQSFRKTPPAATCPAHTEPPQYTP